MLSLPKLLVLAAIVFAVWYAFNHIVRLGQQQQQRRGPRRGPQMQRGRQARGAGPAAGGNAAVELTACPRCGTYVAAGGASPCNRPDCPWRT